MLDVEHPFAQATVIATATAPTTSTAAVSTSSHGSIGALLSHHRSLLLSHGKLSHFRSLLERSSTYTKPADDPYELPSAIKTITLNRHLAAKVREKGSREQRLAHSLLTQTKAAIGHWSPAELRRHYTKIDDGGQVSIYPIVIASGR